MLRNIDHIAKFLLAACDTQTWVAITDYINERLTYDSNLLNGKKEIKGIYTIRIDSTEK